MSQESQNFNDNQEIDLSQISKKIGGFFEGISNRFFRGILFVKRNLIILIVLVIVGLGLGFFIDSNKVYNSQIIISPSLGGVDYLYSKIDLLSSKLSEKDITFINSIGIKNSKQIKKIKIEPIIDLYNFVNNNTAIASNAQNTQNFEVIKLLAENNDINEVIKDELTSKNYPYHSLVITTDERINSEDIIQPILKFLNTDDYLKKVTKINKENVLYKLEKSNEQIIQIDSLINSISRNIGKNDKASNLIYNNENSELNGLFDLKNKLINEIAYNKLQLIKIDSFIKDISITSNVVNQKGVNGKMKFVLPIVFCFLFIIVSIFISFYKKQSVKLKNSFQK